MYILQECKFWFCRPDGIGTVTAEEKEKFDEIKERLRVLLESQITHFRYVLLFSFLLNFITKFYR